jgi:hypothetical protein
VNEYLSSSVTTLITSVSAYRSRNSLGIDRLDGWKQH